MTSPLPPKRRDSRNLADLLRQDRTRLNQLDRGLVGGRFPSARPLSATALLGDEEDDVEEAELSFVNTDEMTYSGTGLIQLTLSAVPYDGSEHVHWNGLVLPRSLWSRSGDSNVVSITCPHAKAGDVFSCYYATDVSGELEAPNYVDLVNSLNPLVYPRLTDPVASTTMTDGSVNARNGTYTAVTLGAAGLLPNLSDATSGNFSPAPTYSRATIPYGSWMNTDTIALVAWINPDAVSATQSLLDRDVYTVARDWQFRLTSTGKVEFLFWTATGGPYTVTGATTLTAGTRYMVGAKFDGSTAKVYLNGAVDGTLSRTGSLHKSSNDITIGCSHSGAGGSTAQYYDGRGEEFAIFTNLSSSDFANLYSTGMTSV